MLVWFVTVFFFDLVLIGLVSSTSMGGGGLFLALLLNPVEIVRVLAIIHLEPDMEILGPFGSYLLEQSGVWGTTRILVAALVAWSVVPIFVATRLFEKQDA